VENEIRALFWRFRIPEPDRKVGKELKMDFKKKHVSRRSAPRQGKSKNERA